MLGRELDGIQHAQHFVEVAAGAHWITEHQLDSFVWSDHEHGSYRSVGRGGAALGSIARVGRQHVIEFRDLEFRIPDHRVVHLVALGLFDVHLPLAVTADRVHTQSDDLATALLKFRLQASHVTELGGAHRSEVLRM